MKKKKARIGMYIAAPADLEQDLYRRLMVFKIKKRLKAEAKKQHFVSFRTRLEVGYINDDFIRHQYTVVGKLDGYFKPPFMHRDYRRTKNRKKNGPNKSATKKPV